MLAEFFTFLTWQQIAAAEFLFLLANITGTLNASSGVIEAGVWHCRHFVSAQAQTPLGALWNLNELTKTLSDYLTFPRHNIWPQVQTR